MYTHNLGHQEGNGLAQHTGLGLNTTHAPGNHAQAVNHGGVGVGTHQSIGVVHALLLHDTVCQVLQVHLVHDTRAGRNDRESFECLLTPLQELVALHIALELAGQVLLVRLGEPGPVHLHRVVHHQINRHKRLHIGGIGTQILHSCTHGGKVHQQRHTREVLQNNAGYCEGDFVAAGVLGIPCGEVLNILLRDFQPIAVAQQALQHNAQRNRHAVNTRKTLLRQCRQRIVFSFRSCASCECAYRIHCPLYVKMIIRAQVYSFFP